METNIKITGTEEVINRIQAFNDVAHSELGQKMYEVVDDFIKDARYFAPVDTGYLRDHITGRIISKIRGVQIIGRIRSSADYSIFQEFGCFTSKSTKILTKRGWTALKNVRQGDKVLTHNNNWKVVTATHVFNKNKLIDLGFCYTIRTTKGYQISVTGNHPIMTNKGWVRADCLKKTDKVQVVYNDLPSFHYTNFVKEHNKYEVFCSYCGKVKNVSKIEYIKNKTKSFFCNRFCYELNRRPKLRKFKCPNCGRDLLIKESYIRNHTLNKKYYCNKKCEKEYKKGRKVLITCKVCGKQIKRFESMEKYKVTNNRYCSAKCKKKDMFGEGNPNYGKRHSNIHSEEFKKKQSERMKANKNPMFNKHRKYYYSEIGYREDLCCKFKSTWEANVARILNFKNIIWGYETETFYLPSLKTTYTPDFVVNKNNRKYYVEVKGYLTPKASKKMEEFKKLGVGRLLVINEELYKELARKYKNFIKLWETGATSICGRNLKFEFDSISFIKKFRWGRKTCYNISVADDESFISNHIVTHNTSHHEAHRFMITAFNKNRFRIYEKFRRAMDEAIRKASVGKYYGGGMMTRQGPTGLSEDIL